MRPRIEVDGLWQGFKHARRRHGWHRNREVLWALRDVSFSVGRGETLGVIGRNGSGKTTLLQSLAGVFAPTRGRIHIDGRIASLVDLMAGTEREFTGEENILIGGVLLGMRRAEVRERYDDIVAFSGLTEEMLAAPFRTYSAGMGLRLGFSIVMSCEPDVLLVDEVLAVGDESFQQRCIDAIDGRRADGAAVVLVSHDLTVVAKHCDRVALLDRGELLELGAPDTVVERYHELGAGLDGDG